MFLISIELFRYENMMGGMLWEKLRECCYSVIYGIVHYRVGDRIWDDAVRWFEVMETYWQPNMYVIFD
jgi:hypothetical protein